MPRVVIEFSEGSAPSHRMEGQPSAGLEGALQQRFMEIQHQLMGFVDQRKSGQQAMMAMMHKQQDALLAALERLTQAVKSSQAHAMPVEALLKGIRGTRQSVTVQMPQELLERFDSLEAAVLEAGKRSRNRTFGSNY